MIYEHIGGIALSLFGLGLAVVLVVALRKALREEKEYNEKEKGVLL